MRNCAFVADKCTIKLNSFCSFVALSDNALLLTKYVYIYYNCAYEASIVAANMITGSQMCISQRETSIPGLSVCVCELFSAQCAEKERF